MMRKTFPAILLLQFLVTPAVLAADAPKGCSLCIGAVSDFASIPPAPVPLLLQTSSAHLGLARDFLARLSPAQRMKTTLVVSVSLPEGDPVSGAEKAVSDLVSWAASEGPFAAIGITTGSSDPAVEGYAIKRMAVMTQGLGVASRLAYRPASLEALGLLFETGAQAYFDEVIVDGSEVEKTAAWLFEKDPSKKIVALVKAASANQLYDAARALAGGASTALVETDAAAAFLPAAARFNAEMTGDFAADQSADIRLLTREAAPTEEKAVAFVRGEDLRTVVVPPGNAQEWRILSVPSVDYMEPRRVTASEAAKATDTGRKSGRLLVGLQPGAVPYLLTLDRPKIADQKITREAIDVVTEKGITVEEIIRNHQAFRAFQSTIEPRYVALDTTKLRFAMGPGGDAIEATIAGDYFSDPKRLSDWVWKDFLINGVKWKYGSIPELPIIQPEKVSQLPLDIHLTNEYRYQLIGPTELRGFKVYEVRFAPPPNAPETLPLYRGTVWIDARTWARIRISMIQLNLSGEVLSNEERVDFVPFDRSSNQMLTAQEANAKPANDMIWLPGQIEAQQVLSTAGRATVVLRETNFTNFQLAPEDFEALHRQASESNLRMLRETDQGLRYLEKSPGGERVVKEGFDTARLFLLGGIHHDAGLEFPVVPLGGIDYFNFDLAKKKLQTNVFFAGVIVAANLTNPSFAGTRTNLGADFFALGIPFENSMWRGGEERPEEGVKVLPFTLTARAGHPIFGFGKVDLSLTTAYLSYQRAGDTAPGFVIPENTLILAPSIDARYDRAGYTISGFYDWNTRTKWSAWGDPAEYDPNQKNFTHFGGSIGKSFYLPRFQRIGIEANYLDGSRLDRFSKYELGYFGAQRVHGVESGSVRAEKAILGHLSYGFVFSQQFRLEAFYDHALIDDAASGYHREPFQGLGIGGQTIGPWGTLLRLDIGKTIGRNAQDDFVANIVFLKLFG